MPGLQLDLAQASRLWGMDRAACAAHLNALVDLGFLMCTPQGRYVRLDWNSPRQRPLIR